MAAAVQEKNVTRDVYKGKSAIPLRGIDSAITVPGMVDSWDAVLKEYGRLSLADVLEPARDYAQNGFPVSADQCRHTERILNCWLPRLTRLTSSREGAKHLSRRAVCAKELADSLNLIAEKEEAHFMKEISLSGLSHIYRITAVT